MPGGPGNCNRKPTSPKLAFRLPRRGGRQTIEGGKAKAHKDFTYYQPCRKRRRISQPLSNPAPRATNPD